MQRPNILFILVDQLRQDCLGCYGNPEVHTPHINQLAANGIQFNSAYAAATICVPSRQSMLTGQYPSMHGAKGNGSGIPAGTPTFASALQQAGYQTAAFGKMHFHPTYADYGFEITKLAEQHGNGRYEDDYHAYLAEHGLHDQWDDWDQVASERSQAPQRYWDMYGGTTSELPLEHYHTTWIGDQTCQFLEQRDPSRPFMAWMSFIKPHHPFDPPEPYDSRYNSASVTIPEPVDGWREKPLLSAHGDPRVSYFDTRDMTPEQMRQIIALYYGSITHIDDQIGSVVSKLDELNLSEETLILFTSDHGDYLGQYGLFLKHPNLPYDALSRIPLIASGHGVAASSSPIDNPVSLVDLAPTLVAMGEAETLPNQQGVDLSAVLSGDSSGLANRVVFCESENNIKAVITPTHKYIYDPNHKIEELYERQIHQSETTAILSPSSQLKATFQHHLCDWLIDCSYDRWAGAE